MPEYPENWTDFIPNPKYEISDHGNVRRKEETQTRRAFNLTMSKQVGGTLLLRKEKKAGMVPSRPSSHPPGIYVSVGTPGILKKQVSFRIADQVLIHFVPNPNNCRAFRYKDGDHRNTHWSNLEWVPDDQVPDGLPGSKPRPTQRPETFARTVFICVPPPVNAREALEAALPDYLRKESK